MFAVTNDCRQLADSAKQIERLLQKEDMPSMKAQSKAVKAVWEKATVPFSLLITHTHFDALEKNVYALEQACQRESKAKIMLYADNLMFEAEHLITSITPKLENIF